MHGLSACPRIVSLAACLLAAGALLALCGAAQAQGLFGAPQHPFSTGMTEGGGYASGFLGMLLRWQAQFYHGLTAAVRATKTSPFAFSTLIALSFAYGVLHAGGPGHGKAVVASYMLAHDKALKRGLIISAFAALLQSVVAIFLVGVLALVFNATAQVMAKSAHLIEILSFAGIATLGACLIYTKGRAFFALSGTRHPDGHHHLGEACGCGHFHAPDPKTLDAGFSWQGALLTVVAAGSRPCTGAILVLVFALAQGVFAVGAVSALAMGAGVGLTTCALACLAVFAKKTAFRVFRAQEDGRRALYIARSLEFAASLAVFALGVMLTLAALMGEG